MDFRKLLLLVSVLLPILFAKITSAEPSLFSEDSLTFQNQNDDAFEATAPGASFELELRRLKSKISSLETNIEEKTGELKGKDGSIKQLEKVIDEKSNVLASLQSTVRSLQDAGSLDVKERLGEVNSRVNGMESQVINLRKEIEAQNKKKDSLEVRENAAEKKIEGMNLKLENLRRINGEQKSMILDTQRALQVAEEEMLKAKLEASSITKQLEKVHQVWLPSWLSAHLVHSQSFVITHWNERGRPALDLTIQEVLKKQSEVEKWMQPHLETVKTTLLPTIKKCCTTFVDDFHPLVQSLSTQAIDYYHVAHSTVEPHMVKILEIMDPYFQGAKMFMKPYIDQVSNSAKPHVDKAIICLKPYTKKVVRYHKKIIRKVRVYHSLVQANLHKTLKSYEVTKPLAADGLVWFLASVLMVFPVTILSRLLIRKQPKKQHRNTHTHASRTHRRTKRVHPDK